MYKDSLVILQNGRKSFRSNVDVFFNISLVEVQRFPARRWPLLTRARHPKRMGRFIQI